MSMAGRYDEHHNLASSQDAAQNGKLYCTLCANPLGSTTVRIPPPQTVSLINLQLGAGMGSFPPRHSTIRCIGAKKKRDIVPKLPVPLCHGLGA